MFETFDYSAITIMLTAHSKAREADSYVIGPEHILLGLLEAQQDNMQQYLEAACVSLEDLRLEAHRIAQQRSAGYTVESGDDTTMHFTDATKRILKLVSERAKSNNRKVIPEDFITVMFESWKISSVELSKSIEQRLDSLNARAAEP